MTLGGARMESQWKIIPTILIVSVISGFFYVSSSQGLGSTEVFSIDSNPYNVKYSDWTAKWWQWIVSIPANQSPGADTTGQYCGLKQEGPVWFLAGTFGGEQKRVCTIPEGKALFFAPINGECNYTENPDKKSEEDLRQCAKALQDQVKTIIVTVDGINLENLNKYRIQSPLFTVDLPKSNIFGVEPGPTKAVSDGNWVFLKPLSSGNHTIYSVGSTGILGATSAQGSDTGEPPFTSQVTYQITIK
jgi:hypothetical protein